MAPEWKDVKFECGCSQVKGDLAGLVNVRWRLILCVRHTAEIRIQMLLQQVTDLIEKDSPAKV